MIQQKVTFKAKPREILGKKVKQLRQQGIVPANLIGHSLNSQPISVGSTQFIHLYDEVGDTGLFYLEIEGEDQSRPVLVEDVEVNPLTNKPQHVVFKQVDLKEKITAEIPVELVGEIKIADAVVITVHDEIEVEALPTDFPEKFEIDISGLTEVGQAISFNDLDFDRSKIKLMIDEEELDSPIVLVQEVKEEPAEETPAEEESSEQAEAVGSSQPETDKPTSDESEEPSEK